MEAGEIFVRENKDSKLFIYNYCKVLSIFQIPTIFEIPVDFEKIYFYLDPKIQKWNYYYEKLRKELKGKKVDRAVHFFLSIEDLCRGILKTDFDDPYPLYELFIRVYTTSICYSRALDREVIKKVRIRRSYLSYEIRRLLEDLKKLKDEELGILYGSSFRELCREGRFSEIGKIIRDIYKDFKRNIEEFRIKDLSFQEKMAFLDTMLVPIWGKLFNTFQKIFRKISKNLELKDWKDVLYMTPYEVFERDTSKVRFRKKYWKIILKNCKITERIEEI